MTGEKISTGGMFHLRDSRLSRTSRLSRGLNSYMDDIRYAQVEHLWHF